MILIMVIVGDLIELTNEGQDYDDTETLKNSEHIPWTIQNESKIPVEIFSLYSINSGTITINDVHFELFDRIKKSEFSHVFVHIDHYEEMFILFFEPRYSSTVPIIFAIKPKIATYSIKLPSIISGCHSFPRASNTR